MMKNKPLNDFQKKYCARCGMSFGPLFKEVILNGSLARMHESCGEEYEFEEEKRRAELQRSLYLN